MNYLEIFGLWVSLFLVSFIVYYFNLVRRVNLSDKKNNEEKKFKEFINNVKHINNFDMILFIN